MVREPSCTFKYALCSLMFWGAIDCTVIPKGHKLHKGMKEMHVTRNHRLAF